MLREQPPPKIKTPENFTRKWIFERNCMKNRNKDHFPHKVMPEPEIPADDGPIHDDDDFRTPLRKMTCRTRVGRTGQSRPGPDCPEPGRPEPDCPGPNRAEPDRAGRSPRGRAGRGRHTPGQGQESPGDGPRLTRRPGISPLRTRGTPVSGPKTPKFTKKPFIYVPVP